MFWFSCFKSVSLTCKFQCVYNVNFTCLVQILITNQWLVEFCYFGLRFANSITQNAIAWSFDIHTTLVSPTQQWTRNQLVDLFFLRRIIRRPKSRWQLVIGRRDGSIDHPILVRWVRIRVFSWFLLYFHARTHLVRADFQLLIWSLTCDCYRLISNFSSPDWLKNLFNDES